MRLELLKPGSPNGIKMPYLLLIKFIHWWAGCWPGPPVVLLTRPRFFSVEFKRYFFRAIGARGGLSKGEVEASSAKAWGARRPDATLPGPLESYIQKVARNAYKVIDEDIEALKDGGYSEESIFELTIACALGAALASLEALCEVYAHTQ